MNQLRKGLPPMPAHMAHLSISEKGYPVPYFVAVIDGVPDFRVVDPNKLMHCITLHRCWVCGEPLGVNYCFVLGPLGVINRVSSEPPSHVSCGEYAAKACPFLLLPKAKRREANLPTAKVSEIPMVPRNPGVVAVWKTRTHKPVRQSGDVVFVMGPPVNGVDWFCEGRPAMRSEVQESIDTGVPMMIEALGEKLSEAKLAEIELMVKAVGQYLPQPQIIHTHGGLH